MKIYGAPIKYKRFQIKNISGYYYESFCYSLQDLPSRLPFLLINLLSSLHMLKQNTMRRKYHNKPINSGHA